MRRRSHKTDMKAGTGKVVKGLLLGSVLGATVGWLTAPASKEARRRLRGDIVSAREKAKTAERNVESQARELAGDVRQAVGTGEPPTMGRKRTMGMGS